MDKSVTVHICVIHISHTFNVQLSVTIVLLLCIHKQIITLLVCL